MKKSLYKIYINDGEMYEIFDNVNESSYEVYWWGTEGQGMFGDGRGGCIIKSFSYSYSVEEVFRWAVSDVFLAAFYGEEHRTIEKIEK